MSTDRPGIGTEIPIVQLVIVALVTVAVLLPFSGKAFNIDDTLFLWTAKRILASPLDAFGFSGNWDGSLLPAPDIIKNPPLASYYLAAAARIFGFGERALHIAFMLPALAVSLGTYILARRYTTVPIVAALAAALSPAFMVSANTVMCDMLMLALWVWAVILWIRGLERGELSTLVIAGFLVALSSLTKYFGASLIPLLAAYALLERKPLKLWLPGILVPVAVLAGYQWATAAYYGRGFLSDASSYATAIQGEGGTGAATKTFIGFAFTGGCFIASLFYAPLIWSRRAFIAGCVAALVIAIVLTRLSFIGEAPVVVEGSVNWPLVIEAALFALSGLGVLILAVSDILKYKSSASALLVMWVFGTFVFAVFINWTINGRSILPLVPAAAILLARSLERGGKRAPLSAMLLPLIPCLIVTVAVTWSDAGLANSARTAARHITTKYAKEGAVWFQGHWGFQYYMEEGGAKPVEWSKSMIREGDVVVFPLNNVNLRLLPGKSVSVLEDLRYSYSPGWLTTMSLGPGAGFYASEWGPVPYMAGPVKSERYLVLRARENFIPY